MLKRGIFICCLLLCNFRIFALDQISADSLRTILQQNHSPAQHKRLILTIRYYFRARIGKDLASSKRQLANLLVSFPPMNGTAVRGFVETMYLMEQKNYNGAESVLIPTIRQASAADDHCLLYACFTHLGFIQTMRGKIADAVNSFRLSRREAIQLNDAYLQVLVDINISDIYYRNHMHTQSLHFLNEATHLLVQHQIDEPRFKMMIYANKTENFFTMGVVDSLALYSRRLAAQRFPNDRLYTYQQRSSYEVQLLLGQNKLVLSRSKSFGKIAYFNSTYQTSGTR
ncbi:hypothetical protein [Mucilaginibacter aquariorum]|uniref:Tetratricopeptide repeat protein n=1 Tax=Mucilaginibacter aquariorum TaxID=2967225 RepID=A0ABT1T2G1_9SPHI|nr:hypothetical protein [Mucilaginibacter aquariorum]MCQ6958717.1 hypothetical protein [Mucilaginibacter aquariorum]